MARAAPPPVLKCIDVDQLRVGMYIHEFCGAWIDHPFWRSRFLLVDPADLAKVVDGQVKTLWIDTAKGADVAPRPSHADPAPSDGPLPGSPPGPPADVEPAAPEPGTTFADEADRAAAICRRSKAAVGALFGQARMGQALAIEDCLPVVTEISDSVMRNAGAMISVVRLKSRDEYTYMHSVAVCALMVGLARRLGCEPAQARDAGLGGLLHDIGKAHMPTAILTKTGRLDTEEFRVMRGHPEHGHAVLRQVPAISEAARDVCLHHHERIDGTGYPHGLKGEDISLFARMGAVCDVYDALTSDRCYKAAWAPGEALRQMARWSGHFDPLIFQAFVKTVGIYPVGSLVRLQSQRLAMVVEQHAAVLLAPRVRVFFCVASAQRLVPSLLDLAEPGTTDRILAGENPKDWPFTDLDALAAPGAS